MTVRMETKFVSGLLVWKKMSDDRTQQNGSLVGRSETGGLGNAAVDPARSTTCSGVNYATPHVSDSRQPVKKTKKMASKCKTNMGTNQMVHRSTPQVLGTLSSFNPNPRKARRSTGATPLEYENSFRKRVQSPKRVHKPVLTKRQRKLDEVRQRLDSLVDRQHRYAMEKMKATKQ